MPKLSTMPNKGWLCQKPRCPCLMGLEQAKQTGTLRKAREQGSIVARQPAIERPIAHPLQGMEQPQGDHLAWPQHGLGMFRDAAHRVIYAAEQLRDKVDGGHGGGPPAGEGVTDFFSLAYPRDRFNQGSN